MLRLQPNWLLIFLLVLIHSCGPSEEEIAEEQRHQEWRDSLDNAKERAIQNRLDSLDLYHYKADSLVDLNQYSNAKKFLDTALTFAENSNQKEPIFELRSLCWINLHEYDSANVDLTELIHLQFKRDSIFFVRAQCYEKLHNEKGAVSDYHSAMELGNIEAKEKYEKLNPEKRRVKHYITRCCDGSTSSSKGQGACSSHGGVCNWNEPVYETYRKYKFD